MTIVTLVCVFGESAVWLASQIRSRKLSAEEVMRGHLAQIESTHNRINAAVEVLQDSALQAARELDSLLASGSNAGPLAGVPLSVKDSIDVADTKTTAGTLSRREAGVAAQDAVLVKRLRTAGAIPIAKTNLPDLLFSFETDNHIYGRTNNPYDVTRTPGGSSGGEAALLAVGGSSLGLGSDAFGSVRVPAAFCGLASIKPTSGRLPRTGHVPAAGGWVEAVWQIGPMARRVEDLLLAMPLLAYPDPGDVWSLPVPLEAANSDMRHLRVAFYTDNGFAKCQPAIRDAVTMCARFLSDQGAQVQEERPPGVEDAFELEMALFGGDLDSYGTGEPHPLRAHFLSFMHKQDMARCWERWDAYRSGMAWFFARFDVVLSPAYTQLALPHRTSMLEENFHGFSYTMAWNLAQAPAATVRCSGQNQLPVNVQVAARPWADMLTLRVCEAIEQRFGGWQAPLD